MRISVWQLIGIAIPIIMLTLFFGRYDSVKERNDSKNYVKLAEGLMSGEVLVKQDQSDIRYWRAVRTPGYPALILLATGGLNADISNLLIMHLALAIVSVVFISLAMAPYCPTLLSGLVVSGALVQVREFFPLQMTEWAGINLVLIMFAMIVVSIRNPSLRNLVIVGLIASFAVLVRPAMAPLLLVAPCLIVYRRRLKFLEGVALMATLAPIILWMGINLYAIDSFTLAQLRGQNLLGIGSIIGHAEAEPGDSPELVKFIEDFNAKKQPIKGEEQAFVDDLDTNFNRLRFESNVNWVAHPLRHKTPLGLVVFDRDIMGVYGQRAIMANLGNYARYVLHGLKIYFKFGIPYIAILLLVFPLYGLYRSKALVASWAALAMFAIHLGHGVLVATNQAVFERFIVLTFYPYTATAVICFVCLLYAEGLPQRVLQFLPEPLRAVLMPGNS
jgi:hypothetical protein